MTNSFSGSGCPCCGSGSGFGCDSEGLQASLQDCRSSHQASLERDGVANLDPSLYTVTNETQTLVVLSRKSIFVNVLCAGQMVTVKIES